LGAGFGRSCGGKDRNTKDNKFPENSHTSLGFLLPTSSKTSKNEECSRFSDKFILINTLCQKYYIGGLSRRDAPNARNSDCAIRFPPR
jgi:hypothetical protein